MKFWWTQIRELKAALRLQHEQFSDELNKVKADAACWRMKREDTEKLLGETVRHEMALRHEKERFEAEAKALRRVTGFKQSLTDAPPVEEQIVGALALAEDDTNWWRAVHQMLSTRINDEVPQLCSPVLLSNEQAHFKRGYVAALCDFAGELFQARERGRVVEKK